MTPGSPLRILFIRCWKCSGALEIPHLVEAISSKRSDKSGEMSPLFCEENLPKATVGFQFAEYPGIGELGADVIYFRGCMGVSCRVH